jgi:hypothetical protein
VHILQVEDPRYDVRMYGGKYLEDLPRQVGVSPAFDASVRALVACRNAILLQDTKVVAMNRYGNALSALREMLMKGSDPLVTKIYAIYNIYICQVQHLIKVSGLSAWGTD